MPGILVPGIVLSEWSLFPDPFHTSLLFPHQPPSPHASPRCARTRLLTPAQVGDQDPEHEHEQLPAPSPKQVVLLSPGVVYPGRKGGLACFARGVFPQAAKQLVLLLLVALAIWHLYSTFNMGAMHVPITAVTP